MEKNIVKINETQLQRIIKESVKKILKESFDYDNDLDYQNVYEEALHYLSTFSPRIQSWRAIAKAIGFRLETCGPNDLETLKEAIEDAMAEYC